MDESRPAPRFELIDGELLVTPAPGPKHQMAAALLWQKLTEYLQPRRLGTAYVSPADIELAAGTIVQPDVFVVPPTDACLQSWSEVRRLLLAAEILSPSSARHDRVRKPRFFRAQRVPEYWIVDLDARVIERADPDRDAMVLFDDRLEWLPEGAREAFVMSVPEYFASIHGDSFG
jgi:Uma2 family endonuclease